MNLLCPNCQKMLTVPEQFAGQLMKCPLCSGTFTVPALPAGAELSAPAAPAFTAPSTPSTAPSSLPTEPAPPLPSTPAFTTGPAEPAFATGSPPKKSEPAAPATPPPSTSPGLPEGYSHRVQLQATEKMIEYLPVTCLLIIFVLQFFSWVGVYPGGVPAVTQNAWQAAFGGYSSDPDMKEKFRIITERDAAKINEDKRVDYKEVSNEPGVSPLTLLYLLPFFLVTLVLAIFIVVQPYLGSLKLPAQVLQVLPWKWTLLAALNAILLLFLSLQLVLNFSLESTVRVWIENKPEVKVDRDAKTEEVKQKTALLGNFLGQIRRTNYLVLVFFLHLIATLSAALIYWLERRGPSKPLPTLELRW
ncbi:MAG: hypothetical protein U0840_03065 [Gemmataceae bacterium]